VAQIPKKQKFVDHANQSRIAGVTACWVSQSGLLHFRIVCISLVQMSSRSKGMSGLCSGEKTLQFASEKLMFDLIWMAQVKGEMTQG